MIDFESLNLKKNNLIDYLLFNYAFKSRISVWVLNLIKSDIQRLESIYFVDTPITSHATLEIAVTESDEIGIQFTQNHKRLYNTNEIFHVIAYERPSFDIKIHLPKRDARIDEVLLSQLLSSPDYTSHLSDLYAVTMTPQAELSLINHLQNTIDLSLQINDSEYFYRLSHLLNTIKTKSYNFPTKE
ncbi:MULTISPECIES: YpiB family protein [Staphylococcus]|uniref:YpiB family protein n=1 Tax=Staphylococcus TaxID=1279 RepID=UPI000DF8463A|nr:MULTISPECIES: YpiB family protein [unclassified Staphylococcus]UXV33905.1 YpiB family protein [Staphylococcus sp. IVB6181]